MIHDLKHFILTWIFFIFNVLLGVWSFQTLDNKVYEQKHTKLQSTWSNILFGQPERQTFFFDAISIANSIFYPKYRSFLCKRSYNISNFVANFIANFVANFIANFVTNFIINCVAKFIAKFIANSCTSVVIFSNRRKATVKKPSIWLQNLVPNFN